MKPEYKSPKIVDFKELEYEFGHGACAAGPDTDVHCVGGGSTAKTCTNGTVAKGGCTTGNTAIAASCGDGATASPSSCINGAQAGDQGAGTCATGTNVGYRTSCVTGSYVQS